MSSISRIGGPMGPNPTAPTGRTTGREQNPLTNYPIHINDPFVFKKKLSIREESQGAVAAQDRALYPVLLALFVGILESGVDIIPFQPRDAGGYILEAFFRPPEGVGTRPSIHLPLPHKALSKKSLRAPSRGGRLSSALLSAVENYVEIIVSFYSDEQILRVIIVAAHEFGHYQSYSRGSHDENLKRGLYIFQNKYLNTPKADEYTWLVFREECEAWRYAEAFLHKTTFNDWGAYNDVKQDSLKTYFTNLNLSKASLKTYCSLSFLGDDFKDNSPSIF